jgi:hypothetical protein
VQFPETGRNFRGRRERGGNRARPWRIRVKKACSRVQFPETDRKFPRAASKGVKSAKRRKKTRGEPHCGRKKSQQNGPAFLQARFVKGAPGAPGGAYFRLHDIFRLLMHRSLKEHGRTDRLRPSELPSCGSASRNRRPCRSVPDSTFRRSRGRAGIPS